jgi:hypothetical protein
MKVERVERVEEVKKLKGFLARVQNIILLIPWKSGLTKRKLNSETLIGFLKRSKILFIHLRFVSS